MQQLHIVPDDSAVPVGIAVRHVSAVAEGCRISRMLAMVGKQRLAHVLQFLGKRRRLGQGRHGFNREVGHALLVRNVHHLFHEGEIAGNTRRLCGRSVAHHCAGVGPHGLGSQQGAHLDHPPVAAPRRIAPCGVFVTHEAAQLAVRREDAGDGQAKVRGQLAQVNEEGIGQQIELKEGAQLHMGNTLFGKKPKEPLVGKAVFDGVGLDAEL